MPTSTKHEEVHARQFPDLTDGPVFWKAHSWIWLAVAMGLLLFANGANNIVIAGWLAPAFLLRFVRTQSVVLGLPVAYLALIVGFAFQFRGMVPIPGIGYFLFLLLNGLPLVLPYALDRLLHRKLPGLSGALLFPSAWAFTEYLVSRGPFASWGSAAYSQYGNLAMLQLLSVTGLWGTVFCSTQLPGSDRMFSSRVSRDGRYVAAFSHGQNKVMLYDFQTKRWTELGQAGGSIEWSRGSRSVYVTLLQRDQAGEAVGFSEVVRIGVPDGKIEHVLDLRDMSLVGPWHGWINLLADDSLLLMVERSTHEIYRLDLQYR